MSDLERQLVDALTAGAQDAPTATGLAAAARSRARERRRARRAAVAAVIVLALGVPAAVVAVSRDGDGGGGPAGSGQVATDAGDAGDAGDDGTPAGYHWESWHGVTVQVPNTWGYGDPAAWCAAGGTLDTPLVWRPEGASESIGCDPASGYGLTFQQLEGEEDYEWPVVTQAGGGWPEHNVVGGRAVHGVLVTVATRKSAVATYILDSMRTIEDADPYGCAAEAGAAAPPPPAGTMAVCRYDRSGALEQSEQLTDDQVRAALAALQEAPAGSGSGCRGNEPEEVLLTSASLEAVAAFGSRCPSLIVDGERRELTAEVLYWALSPGWQGAVDAATPLPPRLRER